MKTAPRLSAHILAAFIAASPLVYSTINPANAQDRFADVEVKATAASSEYSGVIQLPCYFNLT